MCCCYVYGSLALWRETNEKLDVSSFFLHRSILLNQVVHQYDAQYLLKAPSLESRLLALVRCEEKVGLCLCLAFKFTVSTSLVLFQGTGRIHAILNFTFLLATLKIGKIALFLLWLPRAEGCFVAQTPQVEQTFLLRRVQVGQAHSPGDGRPSLILST
jgi:hypothetical protein